MAESRKELIQAQRILHGKVPNIYLVPFTGNLYTDICFFLGPVLVIEVFEGIYASTFEV